MSCCVGGDIRATCQCAAHYEWWDDRRLSAVDEPRRLGHCCDYGAYCSCMESELGAGCTAPDCGGDDWDEDDEECDIAISSDLNSSPGGTTNHGAGDGRCYSDLDEFVGCAASPGDCWAMCLGYYGDGLVAIDWWSDEGGQCYCQYDARKCMEDVGAGAGYTVTRDSRVGALPHECGPDDGAMARTRTIDVGRRLPLDYCVYRRRIWLRLLRLDGLGRTGDMRERLHSDAVKPVRGRL